MYFPFPIFGLLIPYHMKTRLFLICLLPTLVIMFALNGVFHSGMCNKFFDQQLAHLRPVIRTMQHGSVLPLIILEINLAAAMVFFIIRDFPQQVNMRSAMITGGLLNIVAAGTWNLANASMFDWPLQIILADVTWHFLIGILGGMLISGIYNQVGKPAN